MRMVDILAKDKTLTFFNCSICLLSFENPKGLENHLTWSTTQAGKMRCAKKMAKPDSAQPRPFKCQQCNKNFKTEAILSAHTVSVHDKKRHSCSKCDKTFAQAGGLVKHMRNVHSNG